MAKSVVRNLSEPLNGDRSIKLDRADVSQDGSEITVAFSSETPVKRWFPDVGQAWEVLDHAPESVDMSCMNDRAPFLADHDTSRLAGVVTKCSIDSDKVGRAKVRFGESECAKDLKPDILSGVRPHISVGYRILALHYNEESGELITEGEKDGLPIVRVARWQPLEISTVAVPADWKVGVGRSAELSNQNQRDNMNKPQILLDAQPSAGGGGATIAAPAAPSTPMLGNPTPEQRELLQKAEREHERLCERNRCNELTEIGDRFNCREAARKAIGDNVSVADFRAQVMDQMKPGQAQNPDNGTGVADRCFDLGETFIRTEGFKHAANRIKTGQRAGLNVSVELPGNRFNFGGFYDDPQKRIADISESAISGFTGRPVPFPILPLGAQRPRIADLLMPGQTDSVTVPYYYETALGTAAAGVLETGALAQSDVQFAETTATVYDIGTHLKVHENTLNDVPQTQSLINLRLPYYVQIKEDSDLLNGTGSPTVTGILQTSGINTQALAGNTLDVIQKAITKVYTQSYFSAEWIVMHPTDLMNLRLMKDNNGQYLFGGPSFLPYGQGQFPGGYQIDAVVWGLPTIATTSIAQGTVLVGNKIGAQIFRRQGLVIQMTNTDQNDFIYRRVTFRAFVRLALVPWRPKCFCTISGLPANP